MRPLSSDTTTLQLTPLAHLLGRLARRRPHDPEASLRIALNERDEARRDGRAAVARVTQLENELAEARRELAGLRSSTDDKARRPPARSPQPVGAGRAA